MSVAAPQSVELVRFRPFGSNELAHAVLQAATLDESNPWSAMQSRLDRSHGPYSGSLAEHLTALGMPTVDVIMGVDALVGAWEREFGPLPRGLPREMAYAQAAIERFGPAYITDHNFRVISRDFVARARRILPSVRIIGSVGTAKRLHLGLNCDALTTPYSDLAKQYQAMGMRKVAVIHHSFDPLVLDDLAGEPSADGTTMQPRAVFVGTIGAAGLERRTRLIAKLLDEDLLEAWIREQTSQDPKDPTSARVVSRLPAHALRRIHQATGMATGGTERRLSRGLRQDDVPRHDRLTTPVSSRHPDRCHEPVFGLEMFKTLRRSPVVVHHGLDNVGDNAGALRLFEATGVGATLLADDSAGLRGLFSAGTEIVTYRSPEECAGLIRELLQDRAATAAIGLAGQARTLRSHSSRARAQEWFAFLRDPG